MDTNVNSDYQKNPEQRAIQRKLKDDVNTPLINKEHSVNATSLKSWRKYLVGPILCLYMIAYMASYYIIIEFTNSYWLDKKFKEANLTKSADSSSSHCDVNKSSLEYKTESEATSISSRYIMYISLAQGVPAIVSTLLLGSYTDFIGRKFLFAVGISGTAIKLSVCFCIIYFDWNLLLFIPVSGLEGCTGQYCSALQASFAYVSDFTSGTKRTYGIAAVMSMVGLSIVIASFSSGYLMNAYGYYTPLAMCSILLILCLVVTMTVLPESLPPELRRKENKTAFNVIYNSFSFLARNDLGNNRWKFRMLFLAHAFAEFSFLGRISVETIYQMSAPFCWSADKVGVYAAIRTALMVTVGLGSMKIFQMCLSDVALAMVGCMSYAICFFLEAIATNSTVLYIVLGVNFLGAMEGTMSRSVGSSLADHTQQGALFSGLSSVEIVVNLLSNVGNNGIYSLTTSYMRGFIFIILGASATIAAILLLILLIGWKIEKRTLSKC